MKQFADLVNLLGTSTKTNDKLEALSEYFGTANEKDRVWVIAIFSGRRPKRTVSTAQLVQWCVEATSYPQWLFEESYHTVGDLAETIALLLPGNETGEHAEPLHYYFRANGCSSKLKEAEESIRKKISSPVPGTI